MANTYFAPPPKKKNREAVRFVEKEKIKEVTLFVSHKRWYTDVFCSPSKKCLDIDSIEFLPPKSVPQEKQNM